MCQSPFKNYVYSGILKKVNILRRSSILPFAENVVVSHPRVRSSFFITAVGMTMKNQIKVHWQHPKQYIFDILKKSNFKLKASNK